MVLNNLDLERSNGTSKKLSTQITTVPRIPTWYVTEKTEVPDRNVPIHYEGLN
jgi:hypothetical protein